MATNGPCSWTVAVSTALRHGYASAAAVSGTLQLSGSLQRLPLGVSCVHRNYYSGVQPVQQKVVFLWYGHENLVYIYTFLPRVPNICYDAMTLVGFLSLCEEQNIFRTLNVYGSCVTPASYICPATHNESTPTGSTLIAHSFSTPEISGSVATSSLSFALLGLDAYLSRKISCSAGNRNTIPRSLLNSWPIRIKHDVCFTPKRLAFLSFLQISLTCCARELMRREWQ